MRPDGTIKICYMLYALSGMLTLILSCFGKPALVNRVLSRPRVWSRIDDPEETNKEADRIRSCKQTQHIRDMTTICEGFKTFHLGL